MPDPRFATSLSRAAPPAPCIMPDPRFETLDDWLRWQESLHPRTIELGLERVLAVSRRLQPEPPPHTVITVGGTNGKGSCVALLEAILRAAGYRVGAYTSPHLLRYNERIRIDGAEASDDALCRIFARIDSARGDVSLTYFEFGTLAALELFRETGIEVALLEVGLGGRLDAVNIADADAALVVSVGLDHTDWLGPDRDSIGHEKAGIYRAGRPAICADPDPPRRLVEHARDIGAIFLQAGRDYRFAHTGRTWRWWTDELCFDELPPPGLAGSHQTGNAAAVLMALASLRDRLPVSATAIRAGLARAELLGRFQSISGPVEWILDVAHNPHGAAILAANLRERPRAGQTRAVIGLLADKDADGVIRALTGLIDVWHPVDLGGPRGRTGDELARILRAVGARATVAADVIGACRAARTAARPGDRIVVLGSFQTVAPVLAAQPWRFDSPPTPSREA